MRAAGAGIKTGAARIAWRPKRGARRRRPRAARVAGPVGLNFEARKSFRGRVLVSFGEPLGNREYSDRYRRGPPPRG